MKLAKQTKTGNFLLRKHPSPLGEDALAYLRERLAPEFGGFVWIKFCNY